MPGHPEIGYIAVTFIITVFIMCCIFGHIISK